MKFITRAWIVICILFLLDVSLVFATDSLNTHKVKAGDTACGIAERYKIPCSNLLEKNNLDSSGLIYPGQLLYLPDSSVWNGSMPCKIHMISWVNVNIRGSHLLNKKTEFEKNIRDGLRKQIPFLSHELQEYGALWSEVAYDKSNDKFLDIDVGQDKRFIERGEVNCSVWSSESENPAAIYLNCELSGWGDYIPTIYEEFKVEALSTAPLSNLARKSEAMLRHLISDISERLISYREKDCPGTIVN